MFFKWIVPLITLLTLPLLTACLRPVKTPVIKTYTLSSEQPSHAQHKGGAHTLLVNTVTANPGYNTSNIMYTEQPYQLNHFTTHSWIEPPAQLLTPLLVGSLQNSGCLRAVSASSYGGTTDFTLNTQLLTLRQEFDKNNSCVRISIQLTLVDNTSSRIVATRTIEMTMPAQQNTPYAGVVAANEGTQKILYKINAFVCHAVDVAEK